MIKIIDQWAASERALKVNFSQAVDVLSSLELAVRCYSPLIQISLSSDNNTVSKTLATFYWQSNSELRAEHSGET